MYITEIASLREIGAGGRLWELHSAWAGEFQGAFSLVLTANIIGTRLIPEGYEVCLIFFRNWMKVAVKFSVQCLACSPMSNSGSLT